MSVRRSTYFALGSRHAYILVTFVATIIIARLLTPAEIGVFTVSAAFVTLSQVLREFGIGSYLIQERELDRSRICTAMGIGLFIGAGLALLMIVLARPVAWFYGDQGVAEVLYILSFAFLLTPVNSIGLALLKRDLEFGVLFWLEMTSHLGWAAVAVALAYAGESYRSLAWGTLSGTVIQFALFLILRRDLVLFRPSLTHWRHIAGFGSIITVANLVMQIGTLSPALIMGRMLGFTAVAFYSRGDGLTKIFRNTIESGTRAVALPAFAAQLRQGTFSKEGYLFAIALITGISWPFFGLLGIMAYPIIRILFGDQWDAAVPVLRLLAIANIILALSIFSSQVMLAVGAVRFVLYKALIVQGTRIALVVLCAFHSFEAVAAAEIVVGIVALTANQFYLNRLIGVTLSDLVKASKPSMAVMVMSVIGPLMVVIFYEPGPDLLWSPLLLAMVTSVIGWAVAVFAVRHRVRNEIAIFFRKTRAVMESAHRV